MTLRLPSVALCAFVVSLGPAYAQPLTQQERDSLLQQLAQTRDAFVRSISGLSDAQWTFKPGPDRWSIAEVAEHIAISESTILQLVTDKMLKAPPIPPNPTPLSDEKLLALLLDRSGRFQAPEMLRPTGRWPTRDAVVKNFTAAREKTAAYVQTTTDPLRLHGGPHPAFKMLDGYQWMLLISGHSARHTAQIEEVKATPAYPAG